MSTVVRTRPEPGTSVTGVPIFTAAMLAGLLSLILLVAPASAQEDWTPRLRFDGFGTVGLVYSTEDHADFVENSTRSEGAGYSDRISASLDSRIAGQVTLDIGSRVTGVVQLVGEQTTQGDYTPRVEWANLRYSFTPDLSVRGGRIVMPTFLVSDARKVSYANPWVRPPVELYGMVPIYSWDGVDASYRRRISEWTASVNAAVGRTESDFPGGTAEAEELWIVSTSLQRGTFTGRLAAAGGSVTIGMFGPLFDGFRAFGPEGEAIAARFDVDDTNFHFATAGVEYDPGSWFTMAEVGWMQSRSAMGERLGGYVTGGYRHRAITPYATLSGVGLLSESAVAGLSLDGLPAEHAEAAAQLNAGLNSLLLMSPRQQNLALGTRWDLMPGMALKAQVDFMNPLENSPGTFTNLQPTFEPGGSTQVVSVAATFVF